MQSLMKATDGSKAAAAAELAQLVLRTWPAMKNAPRLAYSRTVEAIHKHQHEDESIVSSEQQSTAKGFRPGCSSSNTKSYRWARLLVPRFNTRQTKQTLETKYRSYEAYGSPLTCQKCCKILIARQRRHKTKKVGRVAIRIKLRCVIIFVKSVMQSLKKRTRHVCLVIHSAW